MSEREAAAAVYEAMRALETWLEVRWRGRGLPLERAA